MVARNAQNNSPFPRRSPWRTETQNDLKEHSNYSDRQSARLQTWDPFASYALQVHNAKDSPCYASYAPQNLALGRERCLANGAASPSSTMRRLRMALQGSTGPEPEISSITGPPAVRSPTGAPPRDGASKSLLSPINLDTSSDQGDPKVGNRDSGVNLSNPACNAECENNCPPLTTSFRSLFGVYDDSQARSKSVGSPVKNVKPSLLQDGNISPPDLQARKSSLNKGIFEQELSYRDMEGYPQATPWERAAEPGLRRRTTMFDEGDVFVSVSRGRAIAGEDVASPTCFPPCETPGSSFSTVKEAHLTTMTSPSRPQIINIPRRGSTVSPLPPIDRLGPSSSVKWDHLFVTPPEAPATPSTSSQGNHEAQEFERTRRLSEAMMAHSRAPITPPNSPIESEGMSSEFSYPQVQIGDSRIPNHGMKRYQPTAWILDELEFLATNFPSTRLQLDSPVIQHIRREMITIADSPLADPPLAWSSAPRSRYSTHCREVKFRPLSNHLEKHGGAERFRNAQRDPCALGLGTNWSTAPRTLYALQTVFPTATSHTLDCVQATSFALAYLSSMQICHNRASSAPNDPGSPTGLPDTYRSVPSKAQEMLGLKMHPAPSYSGTSWLRSQTSERPGDSSWRRLESLRATLNGVFRDLLAEMCRRRLGREDDAFVRAVQEMIRLGEGEGKGEEHHTGLSGGRKIYSCASTEMRRGHERIHRYSCDVK